MSEFLSMLLRLSLFGSALAVLLFLLKPLMRGRVSRRVQYYLWLLVLLRLCVPMGLTLPLPSGPPAVPEPIPIAAEDFKQAPAVQTAEPRTAVRPQTPPAVSALPEEKGISPDTAFFLLWAAGTAGFAAWYIAGYGTLCRRVRTGASAPRREAVDLLREMDPSGKVRLVESGAVDTPLLLGVIRPAIVLPSRYADPGQLRDIFAHELTHIRRHDLLYKWFAAFAASVHWFNPLLFFVRREVGRACELACDEAVIRTLDVSDRRHYGETLLSLAVPARPLPLAVTMCEEKRNLKERLVAIVKLRKKGPLTVLLTLVLVAVAVCCALFISAAPRESAEQFRTPSGYITLEMGMTRKDVEKQLRDVLSRQSVQWSQWETAEAVTYTAHWDQENPVTVYYAYSEVEDTDIVVGLEAEGSDFSWTSRSGGTSGQTLAELQALYPEGQLLEVPAEDGDAGETIYYVIFPYNKYCNILTFFFSDNGQVDGMTIGYGPNPYLDGRDHFYDPQRRTFLTLGMHREEVEARVGQGKQLPEEDVTQYMLDRTQLSLQNLPAFYSYGSGAEQITVGYLDDVVITLRVNSTPSRWQTIQGVTTGDSSSAMKRYGWDTGGVRKVHGKGADFGLAVAQTVSGRQFWDMSGDLVTVYYTEQDGILSLCLTVPDYADTFSAQDFFDPEPFHHPGLGVTVNLDMTQAEVEALLGSGTLLSEKQDLVVYRYGSGADALQVAYQLGRVTQLVAGSGDSEPFHWQTESGIGYGSSVAQAQKLMDFACWEGEDQLASYTILAPKNVNCGYPYFSGLATEELGVIQLAESVSWEGDVYYNYPYPNAEYPNAEQ